MVLSERTDWQAVFDGLAVKKAGKDIIYTVEEEATDVINGTDGPGTYAFRISGNVQKGFTITNTHTPETTKVEGEKIWDDNNNQEQKRPASITIRLLADGRPYDSRVVTEEDDWKWTFTGLPKYDNGQEITYTISEDAVENYLPDITGYEVKNTYEPGKTSVTVTKRW